MIESLAKLIGFAAVGLAVAIGLAMLANLKRWRRPLK